MQQKQNLFVVIICAVIIGLVLRSCLRQETNPVGNIMAEPKTIVTWGLFDPQEVYGGMIQQYESEHRDIRIQYYKIGDDPEAYEQMLLNEIAEGKGPDIFMLKNTWLERHQGKLAPLPYDLEVNLDTFRKAFYPVVGDDLIRDDENGSPRIYGVPMYVDNLALYYNRSFFRDYIPSRSAPGKTWDEIIEDTLLLTHEDSDAFEHFGLMGIAMGRADNIARAMDILYLLFLQHGVQLYDEPKTTAVFARTAGAQNPALEALSFFTSFAMPDGRNYCWNMDSTLNNPAKEVAAFARGKVAMIVGYSYLYEDIIQTIRDLQTKGENTITTDDIGISEIPQLVTPTNDVYITYASYTPFVVNRNSPYQKESWEFLLWLIKQENLREYNRQTHLPSPMPILQAEQAEDAIYGVFARQLPGAKSYELVSEKEINEIFEEMITQINDGYATAEEALQKAGESVNTMLETALEVKNAQRDSTNNTTLDVQEK